MVTAICPVYNVSRSVITFQENVRTSFRKIITDCNTCKKHFDIGTEALCLLLQSHGSGFHSLFSPDIVNISQIESISSSLRCFIVENGVELKVI